MARTISAPSGRRIWTAIRDELMLNLYPLPFSTLVPTVYHVYLHPDDFAVVEPVVPRIVAQVQRALSAEVDGFNSRLERSGRRALNRLLVREEVGPIEAPASGWEVHVHADRNAELERGQLGIVSTLALPAPVEYAGTPTTRIVRSVVSGGRRSATAVEMPVEAPPPALPGPAAGDHGIRARLRYHDEQGTHPFEMRKDSLSIGRGGSSAWVDVQVAATSKVSREHVRLRRDAQGRFFIQDVSLWGTSVDGQPIPPAVKTREGVTQPGAEHALPARARIELADAVVIDFDAMTEP